MAAVTFDVPNDVLAALHASPEQISDEVRLAAAVHWYHRGELSTAMAAKLAGMDRITFLDTLAAACAAKMPCIMALKRAAGGPLPATSPSAKPNAPVGRST